MSIFIGLMFATLANALEYRAIIAPKAIAYDAPSLEAKKLYIFNQGYPLEIIVNSGDWIKVRDNEGALAWIEAKHLTNKRTVMALKDTPIRQSPDDAAPLVATAEKGVLMALLDSTAKNGWLKIKHRDGISGYISTTEIWGY